MKQEGSAAIAALGIVILCTALAAAFYGSYYSVAMPLLKSTMELAARSEALTAIDSIMEALESNGEDGVDSKADLTRLPVLDGLEYAVEDISSRLNLNFIPAEVFESPTMSILAGGSSGFIVLRDLREQAGPSMDFATSFGTVVDVAAIGRWFTPYSYANINTDDPAAISRFYARITGDVNGEVTIKDKIENLRSAKKTLDRSGFTLGFSLPSVLYPIIGVEPQINPNHAERTVMEAILSAPAYKVKDPMAACDALCNAADNDTLDLKKIKSVLGSDADPRLAAWFGVRTWFWRVSLSVRGTRYIAILRRTGPVAGGNGLVLAGFFKDTVDYDE